MKISVIGAGYVGLISALCLAYKGHEVFIVEKNLSVVKMINSGIPHIYEDGLKDLLIEVIKHNRFKATNDLEQALRSSEVAIIAVGTPSKEGNINLDYIEKVTRDIGRYIRQNKPISVIIKSTVTPGTTDGFVKAILKSESGLNTSEVGLGMNPEFLREGNAIKDFMNPDRIVFGCDDDLILRIFKEIYKPWNCQKLIVNARTAEFIKYASNTILASQISLSNELSNLAHAITGIDMHKVLEGVHSDKRWSPNINGKIIKPEILSYQYPGCGFGGSCFPKDIEALLALGTNFNQQMPIISSVISVNENQPYEVIKNLRKYYPSMKSINVLVLGLSFKPCTDDVRYSPAIKIVKKLVQLKANIYVHDPVSINNFMREINNYSESISPINDWKNVLNKVEIIIIVTKWDEYKDLENLSTTAGTIYDCRRMLNSKKLKVPKYLSISVN